MRTVACTLSLLNLLAWSLAAQAAPDLAPNPHVWKPATTSVAVFKNGLGYFTREGAVQLRDGWCAAEQIPPAAFGAFSIYAHGEGATVDIVASGPGEEVAFDGVDAPDTVAARRSRLEASRGMEVALSYTRHGSERTAAGAIVSLGEAYVVLENSESSFAVPIDGISRMQVQKLPVRAHVSDGGGGSPSDATLGMGYLRHDITWIPEYTLRVLDETTAELTLRGTLVNNAEDLIGCDVHFVVGAPHFAHSEQLSPMAAGQALRQAAAMLPGNQAVSNQAIGFVGGQEGGVGDFVLDPDSLAAQGLRTPGDPAASDFTVYTKEGLTVRRGERAAVTLFTETVRYDHIYRWTPPARIRHFLRLQNSGNTAWTTGPCLATSGNRPLSEDLLYYTPKGATAEFPVTAAVNVQHTHLEKEVDRTFKAYTIHNSQHLDLVQLAGALTVSNYEPKPITVAIDLPVNGKPLEASDEGTTELSTDQLSLSERRGWIRWEVEVASGEKKALSYAYERYVPSK